MDEGLPGSPSLAGKQQPLVSHARKARAEAAQRIGKELQEVLRHAASALLRLAQPETISGLEAHCNSTFEPLYQLASARQSDSKEIANDSHAGHSDSSRSESRDGGHFSWMQALALQVCALSLCFASMLCLAPFTYDAPLLLLPCNSNGSSTSGYAWSHTPLPLLLASCWLHFWKELDLNQRSSRCWLLQCLITSKMVKQSQRLLFDCSCRRQADMRKQ